MVNTINEARTPGELAAWLRQWADGADASDHLDDNDARQLAEAVERVCAPRQRRVRGMEEDLRGVRGRSAACAVRLLRRSERMQRADPREAPGGDLAERLQDELDKSVVVTDDAVKRRPGTTPVGRAPWIDPETGLVVARFADVNALADNPPREGEA